MSIIRNGGFERGNIDFWHLISGTSFVASNVDKLYGTYSGLLTSDAIGWDKVGISDYISVDAFELMVFNIGIKTPDATNVKVYARWYDSDDTEIGYSVIWAITPSGAWDEEHTYFTIPANVSYLTIEVHGYFANINEILYIDGVGLAKVDVNRLVYDAIELGQLTNLTTSGDTSTSSKEMIGFQSYYAEIEVTSMTGTSPTCDVTICETDQYDNERVLGTFTLFNAATDQRVGIATPIGKGMYIKYVMGGTVTDCDFKVSVIGVR